ncbi:RIC3 acetylcholine receptor chaperone isoform X6 [Andrena cerasifolii]|uniref:RIC3 acetylcholine receptor chaperone isoform X6 n=1 Tax=Andrena cerasifolii TaxID=2819439 RepID=UPI004037FE50
MSEITDFGPRKTIFILAIVAGCFAVLWPRIFYPMLTASVTPHHTTDTSGTIRQERRTPPHAGGLHPALRERGRAIPSTHIVPKVADRPDHVIPKIRPPLGGAGHVVPAPNGNGTMGIIMPLYTLGIVLFFLYTIVKVLKKNSDSEIISEYPGAAAEKEFRKMVFSPEAFATAMTGGTMNYEKERSPSPQMPAPTIEELKDHIVSTGVYSLNTFGNVIHAGTQEAAGDIEIDQLRRRLVETEAAMERIVVQIGNISRSVMHSPSSQEELKDDADAQAEHSKADEEVEIIENSPTVKVMGMEMTASCEGKGSRPTTPIIPVPPSSVEREKTPPKPIYLEGALPPQCELLVTDSETQAQRAEEDSEAPVVLSGKMTLSLISLDQNAAESDEGNQEVRGTGDVTASNMESTGETLDTRQFEDRGQEEIQVRKEIENGTEADEVTGEKEDEKEELEDDEDMEEDEEEIEEEEEEDGVAEDDEEEYEEEEELEEEVEEEVEVEEEEEEEVVEYDGEELEDEEIETGDDKGDEGVEDVVEEEEETSEEEEERGERRLQNVNQILSKKFE